MKNRLFFKIFFYAIFSFSVCLILISIFLSLSVNSFFSTEKKNLLTENCTTISRVLSKQTLDQGSFKQNAETITDVLAQAIDAEIFIVNTEGRCYLCSCGEWKVYGHCVHSNSGVSKELLNTVTSDGFFEVGKFDGKYQKLNYTVGLPFVDRNNDIIGYVFASTPASTLETLWNNLSRIFLLCTIFPIIIMFIMIYISIRKTTHPIKLMSDAANCLAKGDSSKRIPVTGNDEISDLANAFNKMSDSLVQLEQMRRSFVANVSHELRTPMTTIGGFIDGISDGTIPTEKQDYYLTIISQEIKRLSRVVQSMLSLAKLESGEQQLQYSEFNLFDVVGKVLISQEQRINDKQIEVQGMDEFSESYLCADVDLIHQVAYNLIDNAIKFTPTDGYIVFNFVNNISEISFSIKNSGAGIPESDIKYIFDRFYKSDKSRSNSKNSAGLGLYIAKTVVDIHGGTITVKSEYGSYTEFIIKLPKGKGKI